MYDREKLEKTENNRETNFGTGGIRAGVKRADVN